MSIQPRRRSERIRAQAAALDDETTLSQVKAAITNNASFFAEDAHDDVARGSRQPTNAPEFTIGTLRRAIPAHCFERSLVRSFGYLALDLFMIAVLFVYSTRIDFLAAAVTSAAPVLPVSAVKAVMWVTYWFLQGAVATGMP